MQLLLAQHPRVATDRETQLFTQYVERLWDRWNEELSEAEKGTTNGLSRVLTEDEFRAAIRAFCDQVFLKLGEGSPEGSIVLEKSPEHALHAETILGVYPDAWFLHIIRDPRAVANSFRHAAERWWTWAPSGSIEATRRWRKNVTAGRGVAELTTRYREIRYESLIEQGEEVLLGIFRWLGLDADASFCREALEACEIGALKHGGGVGQPWSTQQEPEGFFRSGRKDSWRDELSRRDIEIIEYEAGGLLTELGYQPLRRGFGASRVPARVRVHDTLKRVHRSLQAAGRRVDWRIRRALSRM